MNEMKKFKWFWAWDDEREEAWLTDMAQQGWHLTNPGVFGFYTFEQGPPKNMIYRMDFKTADKDQDDYLQLFADAGWEHLGAMGGWQYFRKEARDGEAPEIYTDAASKIKKYQRVLLFLIIFLPIYSTMLYNLHDSGSTFVQVISVVSSLFLGLYAYAMVRLFLRIQALKKQM
jgi:hypothetical protein